MCALEELKYRIETPHLSLIFCISLYFSVSQMFGSGFAFLCNDFFYSSTLLQSAVSFKVFLGSLVFRYVAVASSFIEQKFLVDFGLYLTPCLDSNPQFCSPILTSAAFAFDAVQMVANAIVGAKANCVDLSPGVLNNATLGGAMMRALRNVSFNGASGSKCFVCFFF